jgi:hypothetical protein
MSFIFSYSSHECRVIHNKLPTYVGKDTVMMIVQTFIIAELIGSQDSMAVIFMMIVCWVSHLHVVEAGKTAIGTRLL